MFRDQAGCLEVVDAHAQIAEEVTSNNRCGVSELVCPRDGGGVITICRQVAVL